MNRQGFLCNLVLTLWHFKETCQHDPIFSGHDHTSRLGVHLADRSCHCGDLNPDQQRFFFRHRAKNGPPGPPSHLSLREEALPGAKGIVLPSENVNPQEVHLPKPSSKVLVVFAREKLQNPVLGCPLLENPSHWLMFEVCITANPALEMPCSRKTDSKLLHSCSQLFGSCQLPKTRFQRATSNSLGVFPPGALFFDSDLRRKRRP